MDREDYLYIAKIAELAERYDDMVEAMRKVVAVRTELTVEERNLLSVAYKNVINPRRGSWRVLNSLEEKGKSNGNEGHLALIRSFKATILKELHEILTDAITVVDDHLLTSSESIESKLYFNKMKGDFYRYKVEIATDQTSKESSSTLSNECYKTCHNLSQGMPLNATSLGLALSFSVFQYEILNDRKRSYEMAKQAYDDAIGRLDELNENDYKDCTVILQLLRDNLTLWSEQSDE